VLKASDVDIVGRVEKLAAQLKESRKSLTDETQAPVLQAGM